MVFDTPEMRGKCDQEKQLASKATYSSNVRADNVIQLEDLHRGKYFRIVA